MKRSEYKPIYENTYRRRHRYWWVWLIVVLAVVLGGVGWHQWQAHEKRQLANYPVRGVTINQDSGYLDFQQLAKHTDFAYLQATSGATYTDDDFSDNYSRSQGASSLKVGVVHTFSFTSSAAKQYQHFHETVGQSTGTLPIMVAVNYYGPYNSSNTEMAAQGQKLKKLVDRLRWYKQGVIIFANKQVLNQFVRPVLPGEAYWVAGGKLAGHVSQVKMIEYDDDGTATQNGQPHAVVRSVFNGNRREWTKYSS